MYDKRMVRNFLSGEKGYFYLVVGIIVFWLVVVVWGTRGLTIPVIGDYQRDTAITYNILGGNILGDPVYKGERAWYPFLMQFLYAGLHMVTGISVPSLYIGYPYLILAPAVLIFTLSLYLVYKKWQIVFACLFAFLFLIPSTTAMTNIVVHATGLGFAFVVMALVLFWRAGDSRGVVGWIWTGVGIALTVYAHEAAAVSLAGAMVLYQILTRKQWKGFFVMVGTAFLLVSPILVPLIWRYQLIPKNEVLLNYSPPGLLNLDTLLYGNGNIRWLNFFFVLSGLAAAVVRRTRWNLMLLSFFAATYIVSLYWMGRHDFRELGIGNDVLGYNHLISTIFWGMGVVFWFSWVIRRFKLSRKLAMGLFLLFFAFYGWLSIPPFVSRIGDWNAHVLGIPPYPVEWTQAMGWIQSNTALGDVFLVHPDPGYVYVSGLTGRKLVATSGTHANFFVDQVQRERDLVEMYQTTDIDRFRQLARVYQVGYVVVSFYEATFTTEGLKKFDDPAIFSPVFSRGEVVIYKVSI